MSDETKGSPGQDWTAVTSVGSEAEATLIAGFLQEHGVPARIVDKSFSQNPVPAEEGLASVEIAVPNERLEEAAAALARRDEEFASAIEGEATLMTDEGPAEIDPTEPESN